MGQKAAVLILSQAQRPQQSEVLEEPYHTRSAQAHGRSDEALCSLNSDLPRLQVFVTSKPIMSLKEGKPKKEKLQPVGVK